MKLFEDWKPEYFILLAVLFYLISIGVLEGRGGSELIAVALILSVLFGFLSRSVRY